MRDPCIEVADEDLADFQEWTVAWPQATDTDRRVVNGAGFDPLVNPTGKLLEQQHIAAILRRYRLSS